jgi:hypothetical protein
MLADDSAPSQKLQGSSKGLAVPLLDAARDLERATRQRARFEETDAIKFLFPLTVRSR